MALVKSRVNNAELSGLVESYFENCIIKTEREVVKFFIDVDVVHLQETLESNEDLFASREEITKVLKKVMMDEEAVSRLVRVCPVTQKRNLKNKENNRVASFELEIKRNE